MILFVPLFPLPPDFLPVPKNKTRPHFPFFATTMHNTSPSAPVRIALVGYGSMGKELERLAPQYGCQVIQIFTGKRPLSGTQAPDLDFDVAIDFSLPVSVLENTRFLAEQGKNIVLGTTGWMQHKDSLAAIVQKSGIGLVWGTNFSVGVQIFSHLVRAAAEFAHRFEEYDVALHELHHTRKLDSPSGTALSLAALVQEALPRKSVLLPDTSHGRIAKEALHVSSTRVGETPGTHTLYLDSLPDTIEITHRARNRSGFAIGALRTARWLNNGHQGMMEFGEVFPRLHT